MYEIFCGNRPVLVKRGIDVQLVLVGGRITCLRATHRQAGGEIQKYTWQTCRNAAVFWPEVYG